MSKVKAKQAKVKVKAIRFDRYKGLGYKGYGGLIDMDCLSKHTISEGPLAPYRLIDLSTNSQTFPFPNMGYSLYAQYHTNNGLSSIPNLAGNREDILDTKHSIYKHYISDMPDMGIWGYKGLVDMRI